MGESVFKRSLRQALDFGPQHRRRSRRAQTLTLDILFDEYRSSASLAGGALDLVLMGYRYSWLFERELARFLRKPLDPAELKDLLHFAFGALLTREQTPPAAIVSEAVEIARSDFGPQTPGLVNSFLRTVGRSLDALRSELKQQPEILCGPELEKRWPLALRRRMGSALATRPEPGVSGFTMDGLFERRSPERGWEGFQAMDEGSWRLMEWVLREASAPTTLPTTWLDACAAPGGKLIAACARLSPTTRFFATDAKFPRLERLRQNLERMKATSHSALFAWGEGAIPLPEWPQRFDVVLADLPCSGSGTLHTRPDLLLGSTAERVAELKPLQESILRDLMPRATRLFVSVCSVDPEEIDNISRVLGRAPDFATLEDSGAKPMEALTAWKISG